MTKKQYFQYGKEEKEHLAVRDPRLGQAIERIGQIQRDVNPDLYSALVNSIVGQQISSKAQATIWQRMQERFIPFSPETLRGVSIEELQSCGISMRKAIYIQEMTAAVLSGQLDLQALHDMSDEEVCTELIKLRGVGVWTAEMLLIFSLQRLDVISYGDLAIQRGMRMLYRHRTITPDLFRKYRKRYSPHGTVASLYLWAIAGGALPELTDPAPKTKKTGKGRPQ